MLGLVWLSAADVSFAADSVAAKGTAQAAQPGHTALVNVNTASVAELSTLSGIGEKIAQDIIAYRQANGQFARIEDLMNVKGVGGKKFEAIKGNITVK